MCLKKQILFVLTNQISNDTTIFFEDNPANRYRQSILLLLKKENETSAGEFIKVYLELLTNSEIEILSVQLVVQLYRRWLKYPLIIEDIKLLIKKLGAKIPNLHFWGSIIEHSALDKPTRPLQLARLHLLIQAIRAGAIVKHEFCSYGVVIKTLLKLPINPSEQELLKRGFVKDNAHYYRCMFFLVRQLINLEVDKLALGEILNIHFSKTYNPIIWSENTKQMFQILERQLPTDYLIHLSQLELQKIHFLYLNQPFLFEDLKFNLSHEPNLKNFIYDLFQNFIISRTFLHGFIKNYLTEKEEEWFVLELTGKNLVHATQLPFKLSKKAAHFFRCMPEDVGLTVTRSLIYAQIFTLTEDNPFALAVAYCLRNIRECDFWIETMTVLHKKGLESGDVGEFMDYINEIVFVQHTNIHLKNKSLENLKRDIEQWHQDIYSQEFRKKMRIRKLPSALIPEFKILHNDLEYNIIQLKRNVELYNEGENLGHCVYTYQEYCLQKKAYIFSLRCNFPEIPACRLITIELDDKKQIRQARGKYNRSTTHEERLIIQMWADENKLLVAF
jgi:hypothetical protein